MQALSSGTTTDTVRPVPTREEEGVMTYLHCARCKLAIQSGLNCITPTTCPRCQARAGIAAPLFASELNGVEMRARERERRRAPPQARTRPAFGNTRDRHGDLGPIFRPVANRGSDAADAHGGLIAR